MNKLTSKKIAGYRKSLERKIEELRRGMSAQKIAQIVSRPDSRGDEGDLSQHSHEEWLFLNRNTIDMTLLKEITAAMHRIDNESYGICGSCAEPISIKRLDAVPWAKYCVSCQERRSSLSDVELEEELFQESTR